RKPPFLPWPDIGHLTKWSVSSYKFGFGPECLRDDDPDTFCMRNSPYPLTIVTHTRSPGFFPRNSAYTSVATIAVGAGTGLHDLQDVQAIHLDKPDGWTTFDASAEPSPDGANGLKRIHAYVIQVIILTNHMNSKDTHVRGLRVLGPIECVMIGHFRTFLHHSSLSAESFLR
ncbi:galactose-binding like protein, partial [Laetiporus sulphureus 93-53]